MELTKLELALITEALQYMRYSLTKASEDNPTARKMLADVVKEHTELIDKVNKELLSR